MPHSKLPASSNVRNRSPRNRLCGQGLRRPFHQGCAPLTCAVLALWGCRKRLCNTWPSRRHSIWFGWSIGLMATRSLLPAFRLLRGSPRRQKEFASSVRRVEIPIIAMVDWTTDRVIHRLVSFLHQCVFRLPQNREQAMSNSTGSLCRNCFPTLHDRSVRAFPFMLLEVGLRRPLAREDQCMKVLKRSRRVCVQW